MQVSGLRTTVVNVANNGFGGSALGKEMADAVKILSTNDTVRSEDSRHIASAIESLAPSSQSSTVNEVQADGVNSPSTPSSGKGGPDLGL